MQKVILVILIATMGSVFVSALANEPPEAEQESSCDAESDESCEVEEELERGFDPCLINARLPACNPAENEGDSATTESNSGESEEPDDLSS